LRDALTEPIIFRNLVLHKFLHREYSAKPARAADYYLVQRAKGLIFEDLHEGKDIDSQKQPNSLLEVIDGVPKRKILYLLLSLGCRDVDSPLDPVDVREGELYRPGKPQRNIDMQY
jgi:hypothetical protein